MIDFKVLTWNVENLFPANDPGGSGSRTPEIYERKLKNVAGTIKATGADVIGLQEVGNPACLADLQRRLGDRYPYSMISSHPDVRGIRVAFLSRMPLVQAREFVEFPEGSLTYQTSDSKNQVNRMGRGVIKATVVVAPGVLVNILNVHLKSKLITYTNGRRYPLNEDERARETAAALFKRTAEAVAIRTYINRLVTNNEEPLIIMGDLNDEPGSTTAALIQGPEDRSLANRDKFDDIRLYNLCDYIPVDRRYSRLYQKQRELIDHIMVSYELIFHRRQVDSFIEPIENIDQDVESRRDAVFPDHAPVYARFDIPDASDGSEQKK